MKKIFLYLVCIVFICSCKRKENVKPHITYQNIDMNIGEHRCSDIFGFIEDNGEEFLYQVTRKIIRIKSIEKESEEVIYNIPFQLRDPFSSSKVVGVLPISKEEIVFACKLDSLRFVFSVYNGVNNTLDTVCEIKPNDKVFFFGARSGRINASYHKESNSVFIEAIDFSATKEENEILDVRCVYQVNLSTGDHSFVDLKYPRNYADKIGISWVNACFFRNYESDLLIVFPMSEKVFRYNPLDKSLREFDFDIFHHNAFLSGDFHTISREENEKLHYQTFMFTRLHFDDSTSCFYRFYRDKSESLKFKPLGLAVYNENGEFIQNFVISENGLRNSLFCSFMGKKGLYFIEHIENVTDYVRLGCLRVR